MHVTFVYNFVHVNLNYKNYYVGARLKIVYLIPENSPLKWNPRDIFVILTYKYKENKKA